jgi:sterol desaturase/sphingolipid hydroxylase (fatty acid hydroxylase superfamily)
VTEWLLAHQAQLQTDLLLGSFGIVVVWEALAARRAELTPVGIRWFNNLALAALGIAVSWLCLPLAAVMFAVLAEQRGWGLLNRVILPLWLACILGMVIVDLANYAKHRLFHAVPLFWRFHRVHHSDLDMDCGTAIRHHPVETLAGFGFDFAIVWALGIPPLAVLLAAILTGIASVFNHGNVALVDAGDRLLRRFVVTPDMHRVHHSTSVVESNSNFAMLLPYWDHLFATYRHQPLLGHQAMVLGVADAPTTRDVTLLRLLTLPFRSVRATGLTETSRTLAS